MRQFGSVSIQDRRRFHAIRGWLDKALSLARDPVGLTQLEDQRRRVRSLLDEQKVQLEALCAELDESNKSAVLGILGGDSTDEAVSQGDESLADHLRPIIKKHNWPDDEANGK